MAGDCKTNLPAESTDAQQAQAAHDGTGQEDAGGAGEGAFFEIHIEQAGGKSARPGAGARQGYPYEQQQRPVQAAPGLLLRAARDLNIDLAASWMIGDRLRDVRAGLAAGCRAVLLRTGWGEDEAEETRASLPRVPLLPDLPAACAYILAQHS